jgi:hypothetical protein
MYLTSGKGSGKCLSVYQNLLNREAPGEDFPLNKLAIIPNIGGYVVTDGNEPMPHV